VIVLGVVLVLLVVARILIYRAARSISLK